MYNNDMYIRRVRLRNFRNYPDREFSFDQGLNVVVGKNASGKTNLIESVYCCGIGKSPRTNKEKELIRWGERYAYVQVEIVKTYRTHTVEFAIDAQGKKRIAVDGIAIARMGELLGVLNPVFFSPDEMKLIKESPQERRRLVDISLSQQSKQYFYALSKYNAVLQQRNKLLKTEYNLDRLRQMLVGWDSQLAQLGAYIVSKRREWTQNVLPFVQDAHAYLTDGSETPSVAYESGVEGDTEADLQAFLLHALSANLERDKSLTFTGIGPHRDDLCIRVNEIDVRKFGSQGQQRTSALSLKLAQIGLLEQESGEKPVLLLDDVLSELDEQRRTRLMQFSARLQTLITCTDFDMDVPHKRIEIRDAALVLPAE